MNNNSLLEIASFLPISMHFPNSWVGHLPFAAWVIQDVAPKIFVELGTHSGNSYFSFCQGVAESGTATRCYAVDTWEGDVHAGKYSDEIFAQVKKHNQDNYAAFSTLLRMTFDEAVALFADGSVEMLHIDGLHTYEAVRHDFMSWLPKLAPGAIVLFHDTHVHERDFGVWKLWEELTVEFPCNLVFEHSQGLGVLQLNNAPDDKKLDWLAADSPAKQRFVEYFAALGDRELQRFELIESKRFLTESNRLLTESNRLLEQTQLDVRDKEAQLYDLSQVIAERDWQIKVLKRRLDEQKWKKRQLYKNITKNTPAMIEHLIDRINFWKWKGYQRLKKESRKQPVLDDQWYFSKYPDVRQAKFSALHHYYYYGWKEGRNPSPYFNSNWYVGEYADVAACGINPLLHYLLYGVREGRNPNPYFHTYWYLREYQDVAASGMNPLVHYIKHGIEEGRNPNPYFDANWYVNKYPDVKASGLPPLLHYMEYGIVEKRSPGPFFDTFWYLNEYKEVASIGIDPLLHYMQHGMEVGKNPNPHFQSIWYLQEYPDVNLFGSDPLLHYLKHGLEEGKNPNPYFDTRWYLGEYPEVFATGMHPLQHFIERGVEEGRNPNAYFNTRWYLHEYPDVAKNGINPLLHFIKYGEKEGRNPGPFFNGQWYLKEYPEVAQSGLKPLHHYLKLGMADGKRLMSSPTVVPGFVREGTGWVPERPLALFTAEKCFIDSAASLCFDLVLVTFNSGKWIDKCLNSLLPHDKNITLTIIDNASTDDTVQKISVFSDQFSHFSIIENSRNTGFGAANNQGAAVGSNGYLVFLNIDTELNDPQAFLKLSDIITRSENDVAAWEFRQLPYEHPKCYDPVSLETSWFSGAAVAVRREAFEAVNGFDANLFMYCEDVDLSWRLRALGYRLLYCPSVTITHHCYSQVGQVKPVAQYFGALHNYFLRNRFGTDLDIQVGRDLLLRFFRYVGKYAPHELHEKLTEVDETCKIFRSTRCETNQFFRPFFEGYDYEVRREGDFFVSTVADSKAMVSVIVRTIGRLHYLERALYSIINQTYRNVEIVVVEDGSSNAQDLVSSFQGYNVVYRSTDKVGRCQAGNIGLSIASGDFFNFLDEDDLLYCDHVETLVNALLKNPEHGVVWSSAFCVSTTETDDRLSYYDRNYQVAHTVEPDNTSILERNFFPIQSVLFRRECYENLGGFDPDLEYLEDWDLWIRYMRHYRFLRIAKTTSLYRIPFENRMYDERKANLDRYYERIQEKHRKIN
jgi:GT2 family glycosyltransferase